MRYLGAILVPNGASRNNTNTAVPFVIPATIKRVELRTSDNDLRFESSPAEASPSTFATDATKGFPLVADVAFSTPLGPWGAAAVIAAFNSGGAPETLSVWVE